MVKTVLGAKIVEFQKNWGNEIGDILHKGKLQNIETARVFDNSGVTVLYECFLLSDCGGSVILKVSSQMSLLGAIFRIMTINFIQMIITSCFWSQMLKTNHYIISLESLSLASW